jgi:SAM-dependent methyltransferase
LALREILRVLLVFHTEPNSIDANRFAWNDSKFWDEEFHDGESWSSGWGSSQAQWQGTILPRISKWLPSSTILEIAPGHGRWSTYLIANATSYIGVDLSQECIDFCQKTFEKQTNASFYVNDGLSLPMVKDNSCDFVFSFDSLIHAEIDVMECYIKEIMRVLNDDGVAFIHHSNAGEFVHLYSIVTPGWRAKSVTAEHIKRIIESNGGVPLRQECINRGTKECIDCFTLFAKDTGTERTFTSIQNDLFMVEAMLVKTRIDPYISETS